MEDDRARPAGSRRGASLWQYGALVVALGVTAIAYWALIVPLVAAEPMAETDLTSNWWLVGEVVFQLTVIVGGWHLIGRLWRRRSTPQPTRADGTWSEDGGAP